MVAGRLVVLQQDFSFFDGCEVLRRLTLSRLFLVHFWQGLVIAVDEIVVLDAALICDHQIVNLCVQILDVELQVQCRKPP